MTEISISILDTREVVPGPPLIRLMLRKLLTPLTVIVCFGGLTVFQIAIAAQGADPTPAPTLTDPYVGSIKETLSFLAALGTFLVFVVGVVWYVWKGRDVQQYKDAAAGWKDEVDRLRGDRNDAREELRLEREHHQDQIVQFGARIAVLTAQVETMRKLNLRMQGWVEDEEQHATDPNS